MKRIVSKLFLGFLCMAVLTVGLLWLIQAGFLKDSYLKQRIRTIDTALKDAAASERVDYADLELGLNVSLLAVDSAGNTLYMSQGLPMRGQINKQITSMIDQSDGSLQYLQTESRENRYAVVSREVPGAGYIFAVFSLVDVNAASELILQQMWIITAALLVVSLLLAMLLSRRFARPVVRVTQAARKMAAGELDISLPVKSKDETGQLTAALNALGEELRKTERLRRELIANVSHELRSPLAVIQGFAETVRDVTWPDEQKRTVQLTMIAEEAARLSGVVTDILDYSRLQSGVEKLSVSDFSVLPVLREITGRYEITAGKKALSLKLICPDVIVRFDHGKLIQVLNNLINNAINHVPDGSAVYIRVEQSGGRLRISVENSGRPIPPDELQHIWERYYRAPRSDGSASLGTGLGLSIVKSILSRHGVPFGVSSDETRTVFWFMTLPIP